MIQLHDHFVRCSFGDIEFFCYILRGVSVILSTPLAPLCVMPHSSTAAQITSDTSLKQFKGPVHPKKKIQSFCSEGVLTTEDRSC